MAREIVKRKPWRCTNCGNDFPADTVAYEQKEGRVIHQEGRTIFLDGIWSYCEACWGPKPDSVRNYWSNLEDSHGR